MEKPIQARFQDNLWNTSSPQTRANQVISSAHKLTWIKEQSNIIKMVSHWVLLFRKEISLGKANSTHLFNFTSVKFRFTNHHSKVHLFKISNIVLQSSSSNNKWPHHNRCSSNSSKSLLSNTTDSSSSRWTPKWVACLSVHRSNRRRIFSSRRIRLKRSQMMPWWRCLDSKMARNLHLLSKNHGDRLLKRYRIQHRILHHWILAINLKCRNKSMSSTLKSTKSRK